MFPSLLIRCVFSFFFLPVEHEKPVTVEKQAPPPLMHHCSGHGEEGEGEEDEGLSFCD